MRFGAEGMTDKWSYYGNSYLRLLESSLKAGNSMTIYTLSESERELVSDTIQKLDKLMKCIGVELRCRTTNGKASGEKKFSLSVSKEMST